MNKMIEVLTYIRTEVKRAIVAGWDAFTKSLGLRAMLKALKEPLRSALHAFVDGLFGDVRRIDENGGGVQPDVIEMQV